MYSGCTRRWPMRGGVPLFFPHWCSCWQRACCEPPQWRWCPFGEGNSPLTPWQLRRWGQSGGQGFPRRWPRRTAAQAPPACGNGAVLRHRPILWCAWVTQRSNGHVGQVEGSSRASGGFGHGGGFSSTTAASMRRLRPRRSVAVGVCKFLRVRGATARTFRLKGGARILMWPVGASRRPRRS